MSEQEAAAQAEPVDGGKPDEETDTGSSKENDIAPPTAKRIKLATDSETALVTVNGAYLEEKFQQQFKEAWESGQDLQGDDFCLKKAPFQLAILQQFLAEDQAKADVTKRLEQDFHHVEWQRKQMDLYEFYQTMDLRSLQKQHLKAFHQMLQDRVMPLVQELTGIKLTHVSASCSMYNVGDYLLVHDDLLSDRRIAYVFYLSPWDCHREWREEHGGALELLQADKYQLPVFPVADRIFPRNNQLVLFRVCEKSFHQVSEVTTFQFPRLTINGWFHGPAVDKEDQSSSQPSIIVDTQFFDPTSVDVQLSEWINSVYMIDEVKYNIQQKVEKCSEVSLEQFLTPDIFGAMSECLCTTPNLDWNIKGPAHLRKYEVLNFKSLKGGPLLDLFNLFSCRAMFQMLYEYTELDLHGSKAKSPKCAIELQRWERGCYCVVGDASSYSDSTLDVTFYLNAQDNVGVITYFEAGMNHMTNAYEETPNDEGRKSPSDSSPPGSDCDSVSADDNPGLLTIFPKDNVLNLVYRGEGTTKFTKYVSRNIILENAIDGGHPYSYMLVCSYKE